MTTYIAESLVQEHLDRRNCKSPVREAATESRQDFMDCILSCKHILSFLSYNHEFALIGAA